MKTFLTVTLFCRILIFESAIGDGADDDVDADYDVVADFDVQTPVTGKCDEVQPMSGFDSQKYLGKPTHMYVTHSMRGGRLGVCRELHTEKYPNGTISYNYEFDGKGKHDQGVYSYKATCTGTEDSKKGQFSFNCEKKNVLDEEYVKQDLLKHEETEEGKAEVEEVMKKMKKDDYKYEFKLKETVLSTDYENYALVHKCTETLYRGFIHIVDNYVVFNTQENAGLPDEVKTKFKEYEWEEDKFATREICNKKEEIKK